MTLVGLAAKNILRNKVRTFLTIAGVAIAMLTFVMLRTVHYAWMSGTEYAQKDRIVTRHKITFIMTLPLRYYEEVKQIPGIKNTTYSLWFGGKDPKHETEFFSTLAVEKNAFDVYSEMIVPPAELAAYNEDRSGAIVGDVIAKKLGWKVGDKVTLESGIYPNNIDNPYTFTIRGIYIPNAKSVDRSTFLFHYEYLNEKLDPARKDQIGWITSRGLPGTSPADLGAAIDRVFDSKEVQTVSQDERAFNASFLAGFSAVLTALSIVSMAILLIMMLILGNTIAMGVRERTSEYGVLRALGFMPGHIQLFILCEAALLSIIGGFVGLAISFPFVEGGMGRWLEENMGQFFPYFRIAQKDVVLVIVLSLIMGVIAAAIPARAAAKLKVIDALRRIA